MLPLLRPAAAVLACFGVALAGAPLATAATPPAPQTLWACHPDRTPNPCEAPGSLDTTVLSSTTLQARKVARVERPAPDAGRSIDCFYVYPTVVTSARTNAPLALTSEVQAILKYQAARFSQVCRVFAPVYRQATLGGILAPVLGESSGQNAATAIFGRAYADVKAAWQDYLAHDNHGRGVVLIGHSQGSGMLIRLMREEIDPDPAERARLVSAIVPGGNLVVPQGERVGGDLRNIPSCAAGDETGCVLAWSTFANRPPKSSLFGRPNGNLRASTGLPTVPNGEVVCTDPAELSGDAGRLQPISRTEPFPGLIGAQLSLLFYGLPPRASTPWVIPGERYRARCVRTAGAHVLVVRAATPLSVVPFEAPYADWGLHLADLNLPMGNLITIVRKERAAWDAAHVAVAAAAN